MSAAYDTFTRANSAVTIGSPDKGPAWAVASGTWGISSNRGYYAGATPADFGSVVMETGTSDGIVEVTISTMGGAGFSGLRVRSSGAEYTGFSVFASQLYDSFTPVGPAFSETFVSGDRCRVVLAGTSITVFRQAGAVGTWSQVMTMTSATYQTNTQHGLFVFNVGSDARFDDFTFGPGSYYQPDVKVEIAFDSGYATPAASRTWTDVSSYVELADGITISRGRQDEFATADPNRLTLTLDNKDGRFTAARSASPYYPNVKIGRPIKVTATPVGGTPTIRFLGYVDEWPVEWDGSDAYASAKITASSRMARLGFGAQLDSTTREAYLRGNARHYWPLGEPEGSLQALDVIGGSVLVLDPTQPPSVQAPFVFGQDTGLADGGTGVRTGNPYYSQLTSSTSLSDPASSDDPGGITIEAVLTKVAVSSPGNTDAFTLRSSPAGVWPTISLYVDSVGGNKLFAFVKDASGTPVLLISGLGPSVKAGVPHHYFASVVKVGATTTLSAYLDGVLIGSASTTLLPAIAPAWPAIGADDYYIISNFLLGADEGTVAERAEAALTGYAGETAAQRIERYASYAGIDPTEVVADSDTNPVAAISTQGKTAIEAMRVVEETEGGVLFDGRDNTLQFRGRNDRYNKALSFTLSASLRLEADLAPKLDRASLTNEVTATAADGATATVSDQASIDDYGYARTAIAVAATVEEAYQAAAWRVSTHSEPVVRIPSLGVNITPWAQGSQAVVLAADIGQRFAVSGLPSQASASTLDFFVEGYTETIGLESYQLDFNLSPTTAYDVWICGDATFGAFDEYPIAQ